MGSGDLNSGPSHHTASRQHLGALTSGHLTAVRLYHSRSDLTRDSNPHQAVSDPGAVGQTNAWGPAQLGINDCWSEVGRHCSRRNLSVWMGGKDKRGMLYPTVSAGIGSYSFWLGEAHKKKRNHFLDLSFLGGRNRTQGLTQAGLIIYTKLYTQPERSFENQSLQSTVDLPQETPNLSGVQKVFCY